MATGETVGSERKRSALALFAGLQDRYDLLSAALSFGQDPRWRRAMVAAVDAGPAERVLDVATGTGLVARELVRRYGCSVVGLDQSAEMLAGARRRLAARARAGADGSSWSRARPSGSSFADAEFDHLTFTYLLRYVDDPGATLAELARVVRPGGRIASLEFGLPEPPVVAAALVALHADRPAGPGPPVRPRLVRGGPLPGAEHRGAVRAVAAGAPARALGRAPGSRRCASGA